MTFTALNFIYALIGIAAGVIINALADYLPSSSTPLWPQWRAWRWSERKRPYLVIGGTAVLFFLLPLWLTVPANLIFNSLYIAILILIIVTDLEHRLIFNKVVYTGTVLALAGSFFVTSDENNIKLALVGGIVGFVIFYVLYWFANKLYGSGSVALGLGDVKLALMLGVMLGFHRIFFALFWGIVLGGVITLILLLSRRVTRQTALPYGQYLALAGIGMLIWGADYVQRFL
ncbi:MAG TPA: prepilin peptidase [Anaerolineae bacterium]|nr:prepilin peptidase [Anaerolineae bacterium]